MFSFFNFRKVSVCHMTFSLPCLNENMSEICIHLYTCTHSEFLTFNRVEHKEVCQYMWPVRGCGCGRDSVGVSITAVKSGRTGEMSACDKTDRAETGIYEFLTVHST